MDTRIRVPAGEADGGEGHLVLTGDVNSPVTTIARTSRGDGRAKTESEALEVLERRYEAVRLEEHEFMDNAGGGPHRLQVWVPVQG